MESSKAAIEEAGGLADISAFDIRDVAELQGFIREAAGHSDRLDIVVNNAGLGHTSTIADGDPDNWREMLEVNVLALAVGCQAAIRAMRDTQSEGHIVNISSVAALRRESGIYGATKHAVNCINSTLRQELEDDSIRVTSIMPGVFATNFARNFDRSMVEGLAGSVGISDLDFDSEGRLPRQTIEELQSKMKPVLGDVMQIADAVRYVVT
jgi:NADP-dependent 3-hydroxy acid dehydrogenase YdfG